jgi:hypothetical protein
LKFRHLSVALAALIAVAAVAGAKATWTPYSAPIDGFTISFPGAPKVATAKSPATVDGFYRTYAVDLTNSAFLVSVLHYPTASTPPATDATYRTFLDNYASGSACKIRSTRDLTVGGRPALEAVCLDAKAKIDHVVDTFLNGDYLYIVVSAGPKGYAKGTTAATFRDSLSLQPVVTPAPPQPSASPVP